MTHPVPAVLAGGLLLLSGAVLAGPGATPDEPKADKSIVLSNKSVSAKVQNGSAFDCGDVDLAGHKKLIVPEGTTVARGGEGPKARLYVKKALDFAGHPPKPVSIIGGRNNLGCATATEAGALVLATYGEWESKEGGAKIQLVVVVPDGIVVEKRGGLSGPGSKAHPGPGAPRPAPKEGYWYGPSAPAAGWKAVPLVPDEGRRAENP